MVTVEEGVSLAEVDEALGYVAISLKTDKYGDRMNHRKKALYLESIDALLDERLTLMKKSL
jgi:hypothetical protein